MTQGGAGMKVVAIGTGLLVAVLAGWGCSPAQAQWFPRPYPYGYPPAYYPPPPVYRPVYPPPPIYAPPVYAPQPYYPPPPPRPSASLMEMQRLLAQLGYDPGPVDGLAGPRLADAVQAFQRDHEQSPNGRLSGETMGAIREAARTRESQSVPVPTTSGPTIDVPSFTSNPSPSPPSSSPPRSTLSVKPSSP